MNIQVNLEAVNIFTKLFEYLQTLKREDHYPLRHEIMQGLIYQINLMESSQAVWLIKMGVQITKVMSITKNKKILEICEKYLEAKTHGI